MQRPHKLETLTPESSQVDTSLATLSPFWLLHHPLGPTNDFAINIKKRSREREKSLYGNYFWVAFMFFCVEKRLAIISLLEKLKRGFVEFMPRFVVMFVYGTLVGFKRGR